MSRHPTLLVDTLSSIFSGNPSCLMSCSIVSKKTKKEGTLEFWKRKFTSCLLSVHYLICWQNPLEFLYVWYLIYFRTNMFITAYWFWCLIDYSSRCKKCVLCTRIYGWGEPFVVTCAVLRFWLRGDWCHDGHFDRCPGSCVNRIQWVHPVPKGKECM